MQLLLTLLILASCSTTGNMRSPWPAYPVNPFVIQLDIPGPEDSAGGLIVADLNGDGRMDYLGTVPNHLTAHAHDGRKLWTLETDLWIGGSSERIGLPGHHGPGVQAADIDGDKQVEVLFLTQDGTLHVVDG
ncbi:MAG: VCBS repeat-containing protein, partial [Gemmatimonadetes bacterium]|nr:VCBS repeat-containing protein [Gemmatimonadota bacterium]